MDTKKSKLRLATTLHGDTLEYGGSGSDAGGESIRSVSSGNNSPRSQSSLRDLGRMQREDEEREEVSYKLDGRQIMVRTSSRYHQAPGSPQMWVATTPSDISTPRRELSPVRGANPKAVFIGGGTGLLSRASSGCSSVDDLALLNSHYKTTAGEVPIRHVTARHRNEPQINEFASIDSHRRVKEPVWPDRHQPTATVEPDPMHKAGLSMYAHVPVTFGARPPLLDGAAMVRIKNRLYFYGGKLQGGDYSDKIYVFNVTTYMLSLVDVKVKLSNGPRRLPRVTGAVGFTTDNRHIYYFGGYSGDTLDYTSAVHCFDTLLQRFYEVPSFARTLPVPCGRVGHTIVASYNDQTPKFYLFGGRGSDGVLNDFWTITIDCNSNGGGENVKFRTMWNPANSDAEVPSPRAYHTAHMVTGTIYVFGGSDGDGHIDDSVWAYDLVTAMWTQKFRYVPRSMHCSAVLYNRYMLVVGGHYSGNRVESLIDVVDLASGRFVTRFLPGEGPVDAVRHTGVVYDSRWFIVGGVDDGTRVSRFLRIIELPYANLFPSNDNLAPPSPPPVEPHRPATTVP